MYKADGREAVYSGPAIVLGVANQEFAAMLRSSHMGEMAHRPEMFVIPEGQHVTKVKD